MSLTSLTDDYLADLRKDLQNQTSNLNKKLKELYNQLDEIDLEFNRRFAERNSTGTQTDKWVITQRIDDHYPEIQNRDELEPYIRATGKLYLFQKRLSLTAVREELDYIQREKQFWLDKLEGNNWNEETCTECLSNILEQRIEEQTLTENEASILKQEHEHALKTVRALNSWKAYTTNVLDDFYRIPGIVLREKITLSQRKR